MKKEEVTIAVFIVKKIILRSCENMGGSDAGIVRNGHIKTDVACLRRLWTILRVALVENSIKLIFESQTHKAAFQYKFAHSTVRQVLPLALGKSIFYTILDFQLCNFSGYPVPAFVPASSMYYMQQSLTLFVEFIDVPNYIQLLTPSNGCPTFVRAGSKCVIFLFMFKYFLSLSFITNPTLNASSLSCVTTSSNSHSDRPSINTSSSYAE
jgi:hypothetical protein